MRNMKIRMKMAVSFTIVCLFAIATGIVGIYGMKAINSADSNIYKGSLSVAYALGEARENLQKQLAALSRYAIYTGDDGKVLETANELKSLDSAMKTLFVNYESALEGVKPDAAYSEAVRLYQSEFSGIKENAQSAAADSSKAVADITEAQFTDTTTGAILNGLTVAMSNSLRSADEAGKESSELYSRMTVVVIAMIAASAAVSLFLVFYVSSQISKPLTVMTEYLKNVAATGSLSLRKDDENLIAQCAQIKDEIGVCVTSVAGWAGRIFEVTKAIETISGGDLTCEFTALSDKDTMGVPLRNMIDNLNSMFGEIESSTTQVTTGARQISNGAQTLAQGSSQQAAAVEELSSSISGISKKTKDNAEMAAHASELAGTIKQSAEKGSRQMDQMLAAVKEIQDASKSISKVIKVIDDIAFQTNILALNAAVEAARAGQHGKGFAVVAEEVRNLAAKSAAAAKDTESLIANSMEKSELGARIAGETAMSLSEIVQGINESGQIIEKMAQSSDEQSTAIRQINIGIDQVANVVQQNSATSQESAAASEEMSEQSIMLEGLVERFKLKPSDIVRHTLSNASHPVPVNAKSKQIDMSAKDGATTAAAPDMGKY